MSADSPQAWYAALPPISKFWFTSCALSTLGFHAKFVDPRAMMLSWRMISLAKGGKFQPWRLLTNFAFLGKLSLGFAMRMVMIAQYSVSLEKEAFTGASGTADYIAFLLFGACALTPLELVVPSIAQAFYGDSLIFMCLYLWSREHPRARVSLMGIVRVGAFYFPWAMLVMTALRCLISWALSSGTRITSSRACTHYTAGDDRSSKRRSLCTHSRITSIAETEW